MVYTVSAGAESAVKCVVTVCGAAALETEYVAVAVSTTSPAPYAHIDKGSMCDDDGKIQEVAHDGGGLWCSVSERARALA